jgi:hypothetical protein
MVRMISCDDESDLRSYYDGVSLVPVNDLVRMISCDFIPLGNPLNYHRSSPRTKLLCF